MLDDITCLSFTFTANFLLLVFLFRSTTIFAMEVYFFILFFWFVNASITVGKNQALLHVTQGMLPWISL
jgi:hypothetical protein